MASTKPPAANAPGGAQGPLVEELRSQAMAHLGAAPEPPPKRQRTTTLVPVMVNIDRDEGDIREVRSEGVADGKCIKERLAGEVFLHA